jgi:hypothetical protein
MSGVRASIRIAGVLWLAVLGLGIAVPGAGAYIYWADPHNGTIGRAENDGSHPNDSFIHTGELPVSVTVDSSHIYWASGFEHLIGRANLDGSNPNPNFITGATELCGLALDGGHIYWSEPLAGDPAFIGRAGIEGAVENLAFVTLTEASTPCALASLLGKRGHRHDRSRQHRWNRCEPELRQHRRRRNMRRRGRLARVPA